MLTLAVVISVALSGTVHYQHTPIEEILAIGWGSAPEAAQRKFPKLARQSPTTLCMPELGITTCLVYAKSRLARVEFRMDAEINILASLHKRLGRPARVDETKAERTQYCWSGDRFDTSAFQRPDEEDPPDPFGGRTLILEYRPSSKCASEAP